MTEPYEDPQRIDASIYYCIQKLKDLQKEYREAIEDAARKRVEHEIGFASTRIEIRDDPPPDTKITEGYLDEAALSQTADSYRAYRLSEAKADAIRKAITATQAQLDGFRSLAANHRELGQG